MLIIIIRIIIIRIIIIIIIMELTVNIVLLQKTTLLGTARTLRKVLEY